MCGIGIWSATTNMPTRITKKVEKGTRGGHEFEVTGLVPGDGACRLEINGFQLLIYIEEPGNLKVAAWNARSLERRERMTLKG